MIAQVTVHWAGLGLLLVFGFVMLLLLGGVALFKRARCKPAETSCGKDTGFFGKTLGVVAVIAGIWMLVGRDNDHPVTVHHEVARDVELHFDKDFPLGANFDPLGQGSEDVNDLFQGSEEVNDLFQGSGPVIEFEQDPLSVDPDVYLFVLLGVGLIILGMMLFGRDKTRPFVLKAVTVLGIGAIIFAVSSFFVVGPQTSHTVSIGPHARRDHQTERHVDAARAARRPSRPGRAKRPALRPDRPSSSQTEEISLPPRAGSIPVEIEIAKAAAEVKAALKKSEDAKAEVARQVAAAKAKVVKKIAEGKAKADAVTEAIASANEQAAEDDTEDNENKDESAESDSEVDVKEPEVAEPKVAVAVAEPAVAAEAAPRETSSVAAPEAASEVTTERPQWVSASPALVDGVYRVVVSSGPWSSVAECQRALEEETAAATNEYINEYLGDEGAAALVQLPRNYLRQRIKKDQYAEVINSPAVGAMHQIHARLEFDDQMRADVQRMWRNAVVEDRLWYMGGGAALILALLATLYGYLKLESKTDSAHRGRLQLAATLVALIVAAGALLARWTIVF